jgi:hypothetical protein
MRAYYMWISGESVRWAFDITKIRTTPKSGYRPTSYTIAIAAANVGTRTARRS